MAKEEQNHLSKSLELNKLRYDASIKEVLADKQILARILKYSLEEFADCEIDDIMKEMDEPLVSKVRMEPGQTNQPAAGEQKNSNEQENLKVQRPAKVETTSEEDNVPGEGKIYFDIRFSVYHGPEQIKILLNIEAQRSTKKSKLGYEIDNRMIYYLGRMISAQKEVEFTGSNYDDLKPVRSIWICMDGADEEDSISRICLKQETVFGKAAPFQNLNKVVGVMIKIRANENVEESKNTLIAMLEELIRKEAANEKRAKLANKYGLTMTQEAERRISEMCNWSEAIAEREFEKGIERGIGIQLISLMQKKCAKGKKLKQIAEELEVTCKEIECYYQLIISNPSATAEEIYKAKRNDITWEE